MQELYMFIKQHIIEVAIGSLTLGTFCLVRFGNKTQTQSGSHNIQAGRDNKQK